MCKYCEFELIDEDEDGWRYYESANAFLLEADGGEDVEGTLFVSTGGSAGMYFSVEELINTPIRVIVDNDHFTASTTTFFDNTYRLESAYCPFCGRKLTSEGLTDGN